MRPSICMSSRLGRLRQEFPGGFLKSFIPLMARLGQFSSSGFRWLATWDKLFCQTWRRQDKKKQFSCPNEDTPFVFALSLWRQILSPESVSPRGQISCPNEDTQFVFFVSSETNFVSRKCATGETNFVSKRGQTICLFCPL